MIHLAILLAAGHAFVQDPPKPAPLPITAEFKDGLYFKAADGNFDMTVGGHLFMNYRGTLDRPDDATRTSPDSFMVKQARIDLSGSFYRDFDFKVMYDQPTPPNAAGLMDAWIGWKGCPGFSLRIGQFKAPFGQEQTTHDSYLDFVERGVADRLVPARDIGVMVSGRLADGLLEYQAGVFNGSGRSSSDANDEKEAVARLRTSPLKGLRLGLAGSAGDVDTSSAATGLDFSSNELGIVFLDAAAGSVDGMRTRAGAELSWTAGPAALRAEWIRRTDHVDVGAFDGARIDMTGWTAAATVLLTGESKVAESRIVPAQAIADGGPGAVELGLRVSELRIDGTIFATGVASPATNSRSARVLTAGLSWQLQRNIRIIADVVMEQYGEKVTFSNGDVEDRFIGAVVRTQLDF